MTLRLKIDILWTKSVMMQKNYGSMVTWNISYNMQQRKLEQQLTLAQIAELLGYQEQYHFIRQFKAFTGQTPGNYRKSNQIP